MFELDPNLYKQAYDSSFGKSLTGIDRGEFANSYAGNAFYRSAYDKYGYYNAQDVLTGLTNGELSPYEAQLILSSGALQMRMSSDQEKLFNNLLAEYQRRTNLMVNAEQATKLGLSNAAVLQTGGAHSAQDWSNQATKKNELKTSIANSMISMATRMGSAGIHGAALSAVKNVAGSAASSIAHSASSALRSSMSKKEEEELMAFFDGR